MVFTRLPSSKPVNLLWSLKSSNTCILSITSGGRFLLASLGSSEKKRLPSTSILVTCSPCAVMVPLLSTCTPGSFLSKSSATAFGFVYKLPASNSTVSFFMLMGGFSIIISCSRVLFLAITILPRSTVGFSFVTAKILLWFS